MNRKKHFVVISFIFFCVCFFVLSFYFTKNESMPEIIPRKVLFGHPSYVTPKISPDGRILAYRAPFKGKLSLWIRTRRMNDDQPLIDAKNGDEKTVSGIGYF